MLMLYGIILAVIGAIQVSAALIRVLFAKRQNSTYTIKLKQYLLFVAAYFTVNYILIITNIPDFYHFSYLLVIPPFIALWYWNHVLTWYKKNKRIREFNKMEREKKNDLLLLEVPCQERLELNNHPKKKIQIINLNGNIRIAQ